jgi:hypothetical protein
MEARVVKYYITSLLVLIRRAKECTSVHTRRQTNTLDGYDEYPYDAATLPFLSKN